MIRSWRFSLPSLAEREILGRRLLLAPSRRRGSSLGRTGSKAQIRKKKNIEKFKRLVKLVQEKVVSRETSL